MLLDCQTEPAAFEKDLQAQLQNIEEQESCLERDKAAMMEELNRLSNARAQASRMEAMVEALTARQTALEQERERIRREQASIEAEREAMQEEARRAQEEREQLISRKNLLRSELAGCEERRSELERTRQTRERDLAARKSRLRVLQEMKKDHEGYYASVRNLLRDCAKNPALQEGIVGVLAELIQVPAELETAVEMAMGTALQNIVTCNEESAKRAIEYLRSRSYGRATFLPMTAVRARELTPNERAALKMPGCLGVASELVHCEEQYSGVVGSILGRTVIVRDLDCGVAIARATRHAFRIATLQGDLINPGGSMSGGSTQKKEFSLLGREREMDELRRSAQRCAEGIAEAEAEARGQRENGQALREQIEALEGLEEHAAEILWARQHEKLDTWTCSPGSLPSRWRRPRRRAPNWRNSSGTQGDRSNSPTCFRGAWRSIRASPGRILPGPRRS